MPERDLLDVSRLKAVLTGDMIRVERKHKDDYDITPRAGWVALANELPAAPDASQAWSRRWVMVELRRVFSDEGDGGRDRAAEILETDRAAIIGWALRCAARYLQTGRRTLPKASQEALQEWAKDSDPFTDWRKSRTCAAPPGQRGVTTEEAWKNYCAFVENRGGKSTSLMTFRRKLKAAGIRGHAGHGGGLPIMLVPPPPDSVPW
jgi:phage/plasmid-associated DNA primase